MTFDKMWWPVYGASVWPVYGNRRNFEHDTQKKNFTPQITSNAYLMLKYKKNTEFICITLTFFGWSTMSNNTSKKIGKVLLKKILKWEIIASTRGTSIHFGIPLKTSLSWENNLTVVGSAIFVLCDEIVWVTRIWWSSPTFHAFFRV